VKQPSLAHVLQPKWRTALQRLREERASGGTGKLVILAIVGGLFLGGRLRCAVQDLEEFACRRGARTAHSRKILGLILLSFISILVLSNVITALSSFFLGQGPRPPRLGAGRLACACTSRKLGRRSCTLPGWWRLMAVPILAAYGVVFKGGVLFALYAIVAIVPRC